MTSTGEDIDRGARMPAVKLPLVWQKLAVMLPLEVAEEILAWVDDPTTLPQQVNLTKLVIAGVPHIQANVTRIYRQKRA